MATEKLMVHLFTTRGKDHFDTTECRKSDSDFTIRSNEEHVLLTDLVAVVAIVDPKNVQQPLLLEAEQPRLHMGYRITLKKTVLEITVNRATSLALLLSMNCFNVIPVVMTSEQKLQLIQK